MNKEILFIHHGVESPASKKAAEFLPIGINIPDKLGVVGFSNDPIAAIIEPALTTVEQPVAEMGKRAMQLLIDILQEKTNKSVTDYLSLNTKLILRKSSVKSTV
jgi:LacI family transcriptional regulator/LacI family repressor for deo operon, udp, cdd, tsx, nupC, and nupG